MSDGGFCQGLVAVLPERSQYAGILLTLQFINISGWLVSNPMAKCTKVTP